jgi:hypothetical protein
MRKIVVLLLVGLIIGTFTAAECVSEESFSQDTFSFGEFSEDPIGDPLPCGGEGGGGGAVPG